MLPLIKKIASLKLTVTLLVFSMLLVFFGTLDQMDIGIHEAQKRYFESLFVLYPYNPQGFGFIPLPGGFLVGGLLILNLVAAFFVHHKLRWNKIGIHLTHIGVLLLLISGFITAFVQQESQLSVKAGERSHYSQSTRETELVFTDTSHPDKNTEVSIPVSLLQPGTPITHTALPFTVSTLRFHTNANLYPNPTADLFKQAPTAYPSAVTQGIGASMNVAILPMPRNYDDNDRDATSAVIELHAEGLKKSLGSWLVSSVFDSEIHPPQTFEHEGKTWDVSLRDKRYYYPFWIEAIEVKHDVYPGTQIPKNFSSKINVIPFSNSEPRQVLIYMNHPLRYDGKTFYQHQMSRAMNQTTLLVVKNPAWLLPYIAVGIVGLGMCIQFIISLCRHLRKHNSDTTTRT